MKEIEKTLTYKNHDYKMVFNLNVMQVIQEEYGTVDKWGELTDGTETGEPDAKAVIFGFGAMLNEGIEIENDENGTDVKSLSLKQVGRMITEIGITDATKKLNEAVVESTQSAEKNA